MLKELSVVRLLDLACDQTSREASITDKIFCAFLDNDGYVVFGILSDFLDHFLNIITGFLLNFFEKILKENLDSKECSLSVKDLGR